MAPRLAFFIGSRFALVDTLSPSGWLLSIVCMPEEGEVHPVGLMVSVGTIILARWLVIAGIRAWFGASIQYTADSQ